MKWNPTVGVRAIRRRPGLCTLRAASSFSDKIQRGKGKFRLAHDRIKSKLNWQNLFAIPTQKSVNQFKDQIRTLTQRKILRLGEVIETINPIIRGWGNYYCRSHVRKRFHQLDGWIIRRLWSHRTKLWRNAAWKEYPTKRLRTEFKLVSLVSLYLRCRSRKLFHESRIRENCTSGLCGGRRKLFIGRLLRPDTAEAG